MKIGVFAVLMSGQPLEQVAAYLNGLGVEAIELGCGGYPGNAHCDSADLLANPEKIAQLQEVLAKNELELSALSMHGNPIHPDKEFAAAHAKDQENAVLLAEKLGIDTVITFSGCPGDSPGGKYPNWVTCAWPPDYPEILEYQWDEVLVPFWKEAAAFARDHGVTKIALEMHPGFCVYNTDSLLRLRDAVGPEIGANYDPSHLWWQGMDVQTSMRTIGLAGAMHHFHAKDTKIDEQNTRRTGALDTRPYTDEINRSWLFRSIGYGHGIDAWKEIVSELRLIGYDGALSIEHEDSLLSANEGLEKGIEVLKQALVTEPAGEAYWA
jgi:sugar phosphate isomerase/epimerase